MGPILTLYGSFVQLLGLAILAQGRITHSRRLTETIIEILGKASVPPEASARAGVQADIAGNEILGGKWQRAWIILNDLHTEMSQEDETACWAQFQSDPNYGLALIETGGAQEAADTLTKEHQRKEALLGPKHYRVAELGGLLAMSQAALDQSETALAGFRASVPILLQRSCAAATATGGVLQRFRRSIILGAYFGSLAERNLAQEAFPIADVLKGSTVQVALKAASARVAAWNPAMSDLVRREQDSQKQIAALNVLLSNAANARNVTAVNDLRHRIDRLLDARAAMAAEIERRFPDYLELVWPKPLTLAETAAALRPGEALIVGAERSFI